MSERCTVVIGAEPFLPALKERIASSDGAGELLPFSDQEPLRALEAITRRKPQVVALHRLFALTPRGAAMINRLKADPSLRDSEIRVLEHNSDYSRIIPRPVAAAAAAVDQRGTRRAARFKMAAKTAALVEGKSAAVIDLSSVGAMVVSAAAIKPEQRVEIVFTDSTGNIAVAATVVWTAYEAGADGSARYRAGLDFIEPDGDAIDAFAQRHKA